MLTSPQVLIAAVAHAKQRWCWEDVSGIEELVTGHSFANEEAVHEYIDELADKYQLLDPREIWM